MQLIQNQKRTIELVQLAHLIKKYTLYFKYLNTNINEEEIVDNLPLQRQDFLF